MKHLVKSLGLTAALLSAGCVSILPDPAPADSVYRLMSDVSPTAKSADAETIRIDRPSVSEIFNGRDIVVSMDGRTLSAVAQAKWSEATPILVQASIIEALSESPDLIGLLPTSGARTENRLHLGVRNFEANFDNGPESAPLAIVSYSVVYTRADDRKLLGTYQVRQTQRADSINVSSIVDAIQSANAAAMDDVVNWLEGQSES